MNLDEFLTKKPLNRGTTAKCFILKSGNVFKEFNNPLDISDVERFKYFLNYKNESFLFPFEFVCNNNKFYGYVTKKALGQTLEESFAYSNLEKLSAHLKKLEKNINYVSEGKIVMHDLHSNNIIYDGKLLQVIDPDEYAIRDFESVDNIKTINFKYNRIMVSNLFITNIGLNKNTEYILDKINSYKYSEVKASEFIIWIKEDMEKHYKETINTIDDFNNIVKR